MSPDTASTSDRLLRAAEEYVGREQLYPLQGRIRRLLERLGEPARPMLSEALAALTTAEARVATLAAGGLTNREIAGQLIVTVKAVDMRQRQGKEDENSVDLQITAMELGAAPAAGGALYKA